MSYEIPDLTAEDPSYKVINAKYRIITPNQKIYLRDAVYLDTIEIDIEGTLVTKMLRNAEWIYDAEDVDWTLMGQLQRLDKYFDKKIILAIKITKPFVTPYDINISYQKVYPVEISYIRNNPNKNVAFTPNVLANMLQDIENLKIATAPVKGTIATPLDSSRPLMFEPDPNKLKIENYVEGEKWRVDVPNSLNIIHPIAGAFFRDSFEIFYDQTTYASGDKQPLKEGVDYVITGMDYFRTKHTSNTSGVYTFIVILVPFVGDLSINYHAYGGNATIYDIRALEETTTNLYKYIIDAQIMTSDTLGSAQIFRELVNRVTQLETNMRRLATTGRPTYADIQNSLVKRITAPDTEFHWWTIGEIYKVAGSDTIFPYAIAHLQIRTMYTKFSLDVCLAIDITQENNKFEVKTLTSQHPMGYVPFVSDSGLDNIIRPQFRIIWNDNTQQGSGILLQMGMRLKTTIEETIGIADISGPESCFKLIKEVDQAVLPEDDIITLPSENHIWDRLNPDSREDKFLIPLEHGNVIWAGSVPLNRPDSGWREIELLHFLEDEVDTSKIKTVTCLLYEAEANKFPVKIEVFAEGEEVDPVFRQITGVTSFTYANRNASLMFRSYRERVSNDIKVFIQAEIEAGIASNPLYLRYVIINT